MHASRKKENKKLFYPCVKFCSSWCPLFGRIFSTFISVDAAIGSFESKGSKKNENGTDVRSLSKEACDVDQQSFPSVQRKRVEIFKSRSRCTRSLTPLNGDSGGRKATKHCTQCRFRTRLGIERSHDMREPTVLSKNNKSQLF